MIDATLEEVCALIGVSDIDVVIDGIKVAKILRCPTAKDLSQTMDKHGWRKVRYIQPVDHRTIEVGLQIWELVQA